MRAVLKDFQSAAVEKLSRSLRRMTRGYWEGGRLSATCLVAPTGASRMQGRPARGLGRPDGDCESSRVEPVRVFPSGCRRVHRKP